MSRTRSRGRGRVGGRGTVAALAAVTVVGWPLAGGVATGAAAGPSGPQAVRLVPSEVVADEQLEIDDDDNATMSGDVRSEVRRCERGRTVAVRAENGELVGEYAAGARGRWQATWFAPDFPPGQELTVVVRPRLVERDGTDLRCLRDSTTVLAQG